MIVEIIIVGILGYSLIVRLYAFWRTRKISVHGKAVLITGCDTGFGNALARRLDKQGFLVFAGCLNVKGTDALALQRETTHLDILQLDVTNETEITEAKKYVQKKVGEKGLWCIVNNAGILFVSEFEILPLENFQRLIDVNLMGTVRMCKAMLPLIRKSKGRVVNIASDGGRYGFYGISAYCASKFGVIGFSDALRLEMSKHGVHVILVEPGVHRTPLVTREGIQQAANECFASSPRDVQDAYGISTISKLIGNIALASPDIEKVIFSLECAVSSRHPKSRYFPSHTRWIGEICIALPIFMRDWWIMYGI